MGIIQDSISETFMVKKDGEILASFVKVEDAKKYWADYQAGLAKKPKGGNDVEASKEVLAKAREVKAPAVKKATKKVSRTSTSRGSKKTAEIASSEKTAKESQKKGVKKN